jgi:hypothetical protein
MMGDALIYLDHQNHNWQTMELHSTAPLLSVFLFPRRDRYRVQL